MGGSKEFATIRYKSSGDLEFVQKYDAGNHNNESKSIVVDENNIYVSGITQINGNNKNITVKYNTTDRMMIPYLINGEETYIQNEIVVRFKKSLLNLSAIDRKSFTAGTLSQFVKPELLQRLNDSTSLIWDDFITYKIHKGATSNDTISCTRLGDTISIDPFWSVLVVELSGKLRMEGIIDELTQINGVENVQFNYIYKTNSVPNDPAYINGYQLGFHPNSIYPNSDINVIGAWNLLEDKG